MEERKDREEALFSKHVSRVLFNSRVVTYTSAQQ